MSVFSMAASNPAAPTYPLQRSVRLRASNTAYFNRTPATATNRKTWTWSAWVKRGTLGTNQTVFCAGSSNAVSPFETKVDITSGDVLRIVINGNSGSIGGTISTSAVFRDPSAWYHVVAYVDMSASGASNKARLYVNGVLQTVTTIALTTTDDTQVNNSVIHTLGRDSFAASNYFDGYLTEVNFIDGQALTPSSFGAYNNYGVWSPAKFTGTYGTNGFYLNFQDNSAVTTTANVGIGKDSSGNGNYWTSNGINVTAYSGTPPNNVSYDSMLDVPTLTSNTNANFAVLNPLDTVGTAGSIAAGNLQLTGGSAAWYQTRIGFGITSGKWYWEVTIILTNAASNGVDIGIANSSTQLAGFGQANQWIYNNNVSGRKSLNGTASAYGSAFVTSDVIGVAFDADAGTLEFYKNNTSQGVAASSGLPNPAFPLVAAYGTDNIAINFGQRPFSYTPPTGFKSLNTFNLPDSIVPVGAQYMAATTYTGNGSSLAVTNTVNGFSMRPDLVWYKDRSVARDHSLFDSIRGTSQGLSSNLTNAESTYSGVTAFNSNGFSLGSNINGNANTETYVGWQWRASNASAVSNTDGNITTQVSVNRTAGFSIVTYTGNGTNPGGTIGHGLGTTPSFIIAKSRGVAEWPCYHASLPISNTIYLNATYASTTYLNRYSAVSPTIFTTGSSGSELNTSAVNYVAYCWAEVPGFSKFGSYTGNGSATSPPNGTFVYLGFRPRWVLVKSSSAVEGWVIWDSSRNTYNTMPNVLYPNLPNAEGGSTNIDFLSNGFKLRNTATNGNITGVTYVYAAFAENPFKNALAR